MKVDIQVRVDAVLSSSVNTNTLEEVKKVTVTVNTTNVDIQFEHQRESLNLSLPHLVITTLAGLIDVAPSR